MKRISLLLTGLFLLCGWIGAQNDKISFNETNHNFGIIGDRDGNVSFDFIMTNNSNEPIVISRVTTTCGCTTPSWTKEPIAPGKTGTVTVGYSPLGRIGVIDKVITVFTNQPTPFSLKISGEVVRGKMSVDYETLYPVVLGNYRLKSKELNFGQVGFKEPATLALEVFNNSDVAITQKALKLPKYLSVDFEPAVIPSKTAGIIHVILNVQDENFFGHLSGDLTMQVNEANHVFPFSAIVLDNFSKWPAAKKNNSGKININISEINFGNFSSGNSRTIKISNSGKELLNIRNVQSSNPSITAPKTKLSINPGEISEIKIVADNKKIKSKLLSTLTIISDDPNKPVYEISVVAN